VVARGGQAAWRWKLRRGAWRWRAEAVGPVMCWRRGWDLARVVGSGRVVVVRSRGGGLQARPGEQVAVRAGQVGARACSSG
jgi:hypothetical protein